MNATLPPNGAEPHLAKLRGLLKRADSVRPPGNGFFYFPEELNDIPDVIEALIPYLGRKNVSAPFWKNIKAVDHHWTSLHLIKTLDRLVKHAVSIPRAPVVTLTRSMAGYEEFISRWKKTEVADFEKVLDYPPEDLRDCLSLLSPIHSPQFKKLLDAFKREFPLALRENAAKELIGFAGFLDFYYQRRAWLDRYWQGWESLHLLLERLQHNDYLIKRNTVIFGDLLASPTAMRKFRARQRRSQRYRKKVPRKTPKILGASLCVAQKFP